MTLAEQMNPDLYSALVSGDSGSSGPYREEQTCERRASSQGCGVFTWTAHSQVSLSLFSAGTGPTRRLLDCLSCGLY